MNREEAISMLEQIGRHECIWMFFRHNEVYKAIDMAIEALKREKRALQLKSKVRNIDGWQNIVNEVARLEAEERGEAE